ncbi:MAG: HEPN domain-containing protein [Candidatus Cloacimonetes bacterium]|nr:HEPN domain-containing protein [Candidatus Cloacimonadota bacterium]
MNFTEIIKFWIEASEKDAVAMQHLYEKGDYSWALFIGHLVIEKLLKALFVKLNKANPPFIHNLSRLAVKIDLDFSEEMLDTLDTITTFNIRARYDDYKQQFYRKCTKEYAEKWIQQIEEIRKWIKQQL